MEQLKELWQGGNLFTRFMLVFWVVTPLAIGVFFWIKESINKGDDSVETNISGSVSKNTKDNEENFHGTLVTDPYRYMENPQDPKVIKWVEKQNKITKEFISSYPERDKIKQRLTELWDYPKTFIPKESQGKYFYQKNQGLKNQPILYMQEGIEGTPMEILDPNTLSTDGTVALTNYSISKNAKYLTYSLSESGSDWQDIRVMDLEKMENTKDEITWCKFTSIEWIGDEGFYYTRFPQPGSVPLEDESNYQKVYYHKIGTHQSEDKLIYERPEFKELGFRPILSDDERYLCLNVWLGTDSKNRFYYKDLTSDGPVVRLLDDHDAGYYFIGNDDNLFYFLSDLDTPKGSVIAIDIQNPDEVIEIIPETEDVLADAVMINDGFVGVYRHNAYYQLKIFNKDGDYVKDVQLPGLGSIEGVWGKRGSQEFFYGFSSFLYPSTVFRYDYTTSESTIFGEQVINFDPKSYETNQVFYKSKDGTKVSMFLTHKKGLELNGKNTTLLYGYGGFNISITPFYSPTTMMFLEQGGVYAVANLRGGSEYGEQWHRAGMLENKQNVFDDFISASEWLIENGYTNNKKLSIMGRSNGGLLVAACMVQRPDLFGAVLCGVPVTDMLRYHRFTVGRYWIPEYGDPQNPDHFEFMYAYSPLHNVEKGVEYPPTLITTADTDDRVVPAHAYKFGATLQKAQKGKNPILVRVDTKAGHGQGKPTSMVIEEQVDIFSFIFKVCGN